MRKFTGMAVRVRVRGSQRGRPTIEPQRGGNGTRRQKQVNMFHKHLKQIWWEILRIFL